jgi:hypothetical protein
MKVEYFTFDGRSFTYHEIAGAVRLRITEDNDKVSSFDDPALETMINQAKRNLDAILE